MAVTVVVPWRGGCPDRERAWTWVQARYAETHPEWEIVLAGAPAGPWSKAAAAMPAVRHLAGDVVVVADADVWCDEIAAAVAAVESGSSWAMPHRQVHRLTQNATAAVLAGADLWAAGTLERYVGVWGGGIVVARRETLLDIPLDPRFEGWGQEDQSWALALATLAGPGWRGEAPLAHLFHPPQPRMSRTRGSTVGYALYRRYVTARRRPDRMRALLDEVTS